MVAMTDRVQYEVFWWVWGLPSAVATVMVKGFASEWAIM